MGYYFLQVNDKQVFITYKHNALLKSNMLNFSDHKGKKIFSSIVDQMHSNQNFSGRSVMEIKVESTNHQAEIEEQKVPLLQENIREESEQTAIQKAISQTFQSTAHLAKLLPTGTVLTFQLLSPIFTNQGKCDSVSRTMTSGLVFLCAFSCFLLCFTDTFRDKNGKVVHGFTTWNGLWVLDGSSDSISPEDSAKYRIHGFDFLHGFMSVLVFCAVALFDSNVVGCFYPTPSVEDQEVLTALPIGIGVFCSFLFVVFPTQRHGIGFPLSAK